MKSGTPGVSYVSTRCNDYEVGFCGAVMEGLAPDGGLFVPKKVPKIDKVTWSRLRESAGYHHVAFLILHILAPDIPKKVLWDMVRQTYNADVFGNVVDGDDPADIVPVHNLGDNNHLLRLTSGPTGKSKDIAVQFVDRLYKYLNARYGDVLSNLTEMRGSCCGDTALSDDNLKCEYNDNTIDECVTGLVNSTNWACIATQVVCYFRGGLKINGLNGEPFNVVVSTLDFSDICAAHTARLMGLPIRHITQATVEDGVMKKFFTIGTYAPCYDTTGTGGLLTEVCIRPNFERYIYYLFGGDTAKVQSLWKELKDVGSFNLFREMCRIHDAGIKSTHVRKKQYDVMIKYMCEEKGIVLSPHTAMSMYASHVLREKEDDTPCLIVETERSGRYDEAIVEIVGDARILCPGSIMGCRI